MNGRDILIGEIRDALWKNRLRSAVFQNDDGKAEDIADWLIDSGYRRVIWEPKKDVEINKMLQEIKDAHLDQNAHEYVADPAKAICTALYEAGFRCVDWMLEEEKHG